jgi:hypothetical protein
LEDFLVNRRNAEVEKTLMKTYSKKVLNNKLKVFCISNTVYAKAYEAWREEELTAKSRFELSGIPNLRRHCLLISADAQFNAVSAFLNTQVPSLLGSIHQWLLQGTSDMTAERADQLRAALESSRQAFDQVGHQFWICPLLTRAVG